MNLRGQGISARASAAGPLDKHATWRGHLARGESWPRRPYPNSGWGHAAPRYVFPLSRGLHSPASLSAVGVKRMKRLVRPCGGHFG